MNLEDIVKRIKRLNLTANGLSNQGAISDLDLDILIEDTKSIYENLMSYQNGLIKPDSKKIEAVESEKPKPSGPVLTWKEEKTNPTAKEIKVDEPKTLEPVEEVVAKPVVEAAQKEEVLEEVSSRVEEAPKVVIEKPQEKIEEDDLPSFEIEIEEPASVSTPQTPKITPPPSKKVPEIKSEPSPVFQPSPTIQTAVLTPPNKAHLELFEMELSNDLSARLGDSAIEDIRTSMGLNERVLTINELFSGNALAFDEVIKKLNTLKSWEQAQSYLSSKVVDKYEWLSDKKIKKAKKFLKLVKRRYN